MISNVCNMLRYLKTNIFLKIYYKINAQKSAAIYKPKILSMLKHVITDVLHFLTVVRVASNQIF